MQNQYLAGAQRRFILHCVSTLEGKPLRFCENRAQADGWLELLNRQQEGTKLVDRMMPVPPTAQQYTIQAVELSTGKKALARFANDLASGHWFGEELQLGLLTDADKVASFERKQPAARLPAAAPAKTMAYRQGAALGREIEPAMADPSNRLEPNAEQLAAIATYAAEHGANWKADLRAAWMNAAEPGLLQQVRNQFGPRWLAEFQL